MRFWNYIKSDSVKIFMLSTLLLFVGVVVFDSVKEDELKILPLAWFGGTFIVAAAGIYFDYLKKRDL